MHPLKNNKSIVSIKSCISGYFIVEINVHIEILAVISDFVEVTLKER